MSSALRGQGGESDDVAEEDGNAVVVFRLRYLSPFHLPQDLSRQQIRQKLLRLLLLLAVDVHPLVVHLREPWFELGRWIKMNMENNSGRTLYLGKNLALLIRPFSTRP